MRGAGWIFAAVVLSPYACGVMINARPVTFANDTDRRVCVVRSKAPLAMWGWESYLEAGQVIEPGREATIQLESRPTRDFRVEDCEGQVISERREVPFDESGPLRLNVSALSPIAPAAQAPATTTAPSTQTTTTTTNTNTQP